MLKCLELFGFKSFADRTRFDFPAGITCVVGPNGSGKSNVVDAMKWILGDQSPKSLRGKDMSDVIFNGSPGRKASAFAEATLTFDNCQRFLPIDSDDVTIGRRLWATGESEYLINGAQSRLKDIRDAFMGTGASTSAYSIIEQGKVGQILQANAAARRLVFEEAAGISRFKSRKSESLRKLERVSQNLVRLTDIVDQLESQLNSTRSQAAKATKYREVVNELRRLWTGLAADDFRHLTASWLVLKKELSDSQTEFDSLHELQTRVEKRLASFDSELGDVDDRLRDAEREGSALREDVVREEAAIRHESASLQEMETDQERISRQQITMTGRLREVCRELSASRDELDQFEETWRTQQQSVDEQSRQIEEIDAAAVSARSRLDQDVKSRAETGDRFVSVQQQIVLLETQIESRTGTGEGLQGQLKSLTSEIEIARCEYSQRQASVNDVIKKAASASAALKGVQQQHQELLTDQEQTKEVLSGLREKRSDRKARLAVLEDLESRQEGLGIGVREILNRSRTSDQKPWNQILGSVADLFDVELKNAALLEVALGSRAQLIVLEEIDALVEYLTAGLVRIDGRVGFLSVEGPFAGQADQEPEIDLAMDPEVVCRADSLVMAECRYLPLARQLLSDTWVVTHLDCARRLAGSCPQKRFITLQGELIEPDGSLFTGTIRGESALLSRKNELRRLRVELTQLDQQVTRNETLLAEIGDQLQTMEIELTNVAAERDEIARQLSELKSRCEFQKQVCERLTGERSDVKRQLNQNLSQISDLQTELSEHREAVSKTREEQESLDRIIVEMQEQLKRLNSDRDRLLREQTEEKLTLTRHEERRSTLLSACRRLEDEEQQRRENVEESRQRLNTMRMKCRTSTLCLLNTHSKLADLAVQRDSGERKIRSFVQERDRLRGVRGELVKQDTELRQQRRAIAEQRHEQELRAREIRHQLETAGSRIEEEYGLSLKEAVAAGASAFRDYLVERGILESQEMPEATPADNGDDAAHGRNRPDNSSDNEPESDSESVTRDLESDDAETNHETEAQTTDDASTDEAPEEQDADDAAAETITADEETLTEAEELSIRDSVTLTEFDGICFSDVRDELEEKINRLRRKLKMMGSVNTDSLDDLDELESRYQHFHSQLMDLTEARTTLEDIIRRINSDSRRMFMESFEAVRKEFRELFRKLFGGGEGDIILEDPDDVLECGIDIVARPPGKELRSITLLSGGEKTMTAVALLLSIFRSRPSPFCILDEVDASLDDANVERYAGVIREFRDFTQFIMITHRKRTMVAGDVIYGVTMEQSGVSKRMSVRFEDVGDDGEIHTSGQDESSDAQAA